MDEQIQPVQADLPAIADVQTVKFDLNQKQYASNAAQLGWVITELLGRCFLLQGMQVRLAFEWGNELVSLQDTNSPREKIRGLMDRINFLADSLDVSSIIINDQSNPNYKERYVDILRHNVILLCQSPYSDESAVTNKQILGEINKCLFYWNFSIQEALQIKPKAIVKMYVVGRSLASFRWYFGLQKQPLDVSSILRVCLDYLPTLSTYLSPFAPRALVNSIYIWGHAIAQNNVHPGPYGYAPTELRIQANIWYSLLIGERDALSYVSQVDNANSYRWKVLRIYSPLFFICGITIFFILGLILIVLISNINLTAKVALAVGILPLLGITQAIITAIANILQSALTDTSKGSVIGDIRSSTLQPVVNKATLIIPPLH